MKVKYFKVSVERSGTPRAAVQVHIQADDGRIFSSDFVRLADIGAEKALGFAMAKAQGRMEAQEEADEFLAEKDSTAQLGK